MARKVSQIIARGDRRWLIRVYLGRDRETNKRNYHNRTIHGPMREVQAYLTRKLGERDLGRDLEAAKITLNLAKHFRSLLNLVGLPRIRLYDLRHSAATIALAAGVSPKVVSEQFGHASTLTTG